MKRAIAILIPVLILATAAGCDEQTLLGTAKSALSARTNGQMLGDVIQSQIRAQTQLQDGTCSGDMNQNQYGGGNGQGGGGSGGGDQDQIRLRLRDGTCTDPNSF